MASSQKLTMAPRTHDSKSYLAYDFSLVIFDYQLPDKIFKAGWVGSESSAITVEFKNFRVSEILTTKLII